MHAVFCYGTLQIEEVFTAVTRRRLPAQSAILNGYKRRLIRGERFPAIVADDGHVTGGVVYRGLDSAQLVRLDRFEGDYYARCRLTVQTGRGDELTAWAYVLKDQFAGLLDEKDWDLSEFRRRHLRAFLDRP